MLLVLAAAGVLLVTAPVDATPPAPASAARTVKGNATVFGGDYSLPAGEVREGNVVVYGGSVDIEGRVTHDMTVFGGNAQIDGTVDHDVVLLGGNVHLGPHAVVGHDVSVIGGNLDRDPGAQVGHNVTAGISGVDFGAPFAALVPISFPSRLFRGFDFGFGLGLAFGMVLLALLLNLFFPAQVATAGQALEERPVASLGYGCLTAVAGVLLAVLFGITILLLPVSLAIAVAMGAGWLLGWTAVMVAVGRRLTLALNWRVDPVLTLLIGGGLAAVVVNVPVLGGLFGLVVGSMALGAAVLTRFGTRPAPRSISQGST
jgi:hypothetical protein